MLTERLRALGPFNIYASPNDPDWPDYAGIPCDDATLAELERIAADGSLGTLTIDREECRWLDLDEIPDDSPKWLPAHARRALVGFAPGRAMRAALAVLEADPDNEELPVVIEETLLSGSFAPIACLFEYVRDAGHSGSARAKALGFWLDTRSRWSVDSAGVLAHLAAELALYCLCEALDVAPLTRRTDPLPTVDDTADNVELPPLPPETEAMVRQFRLDNLFSDDFALNGAAVELLATLQCGEAVPVAVALFQAGRLPRSAGRALAHLVAGKPFGA